MDALGLRLWDSSWSGNGDIGLWVLEFRCSMWSIDVSGLVFEAGMVLNLGVASKGGIHVVGGLLAVVGRRFFLGW